LNLTWLTTVPKFREVLVAWAAHEKDWPYAASASTVETKPPSNQDEIRLSKIPARVVEIRRTNSTLRQPEIITISDNRVSMRHSLIVHQSEADGYDCYWIADNSWLEGDCSAPGTFVNGRPIITCRLNSGDLLQIGPRAWVYNHAERTLLPVGPIAGVELQLYGVGVGKRLRDVDLHIPRGQFVAVVGPSGGGKSTLMRAVMAAPSTPYRGTILANGKETRKEREWFRGTLGYVSQKDALHGDLTALEAVRFTAMLRGVSSGEPEIKRMLRQVDLPEGSWPTLCRNLSGGESKRVRAAAEMIAQPRLFVLDEPGSGLDDQRETIIMRLLRSLSRRGCTILVVTHNPSQLKHVDREVKVDGEIIDDCLISQRAQSIGVQELSHPQRFRVAHWLVTFCRQLGILMSRELTLLANARAKRLLLPVLVLPLLFALAVSVAVPATEHSMLGFLAVLSCIWMGASLSLMSIVDERESFDHERLIFLRAGPYVFSKVFVLGLLAALQTIVFVLVLSWLREAMLRTDAMLYGMGWCFFCLALVSLAAVGMGLVISALASTSRPTANFILPLVMMFQIVFSVQVAGEGSAPLYKAYGEFHGHRCTIENCNRRAQSWIPGRGGWLCNRCRDLRGKTPPNDPPEQVAAHNMKRPNLYAARASYVTLSRWGDIALRGFAYSKYEHDAFWGDSPRKPAQQDQYAYQRGTVWTACSVLGLAIIGFPCVACFILWVQDCFPASRDTKDK
jgi:ABC-type lipoprotein export system ATPase subunit